MLCTGCMLEIRTAALIQSAAVLIYIGPMHPLHNIPNNIVAQGVLVLLIGSLYLYRAAADMQERIVYSLP